MWVRWFWTGRRPHRWDLLDGGVFNKDAWRPICQHVQLKVETRETLFIFTLRYIIQGRGGTRGTRGHESLASSKLVRAVHRVLTSLMTLLLLPRIKLLLELNLICEREIPDNETGPSTETCPIVSC